MDSCPYDPFFAHCHCSRQNREICRFYQKSTKELEDKKKEIKKKHNYYYHRKQKFESWTHLNFMGGIIAGVFYGIGHKWIGYFLPAFIGSHIVLTQKTIKASELCTVALVEYYTFSSDLTKHENNRVENYNDDDDDDDDGFVYDYRCYP